MKLADYHFQPFNGPAKGVDQTYLYGTGVCMSSGGAGSVPCSLTHAYEITGTVDLHGLVQLPATDAAWDAATGPGCTDVSRTYVGGTFPPGVRAGSLKIDPSSWASGRRIVECTVEAFDASGNSIPTTGTLHR
jgi:hypothetical protein